MSSEDNKAKTLLIASFILSYLLFFVSIHVANGGETYAAVSHHDTVYDFLRLGIARSGRSGFFALRGATRVGRLEDQGQDRHAMVGRGDNSFTFGGLARRLDVVRFVGVRGRPNAIGQFHVRAAPNPAIPARSTGYGCGSS